MVKTNHLGEVNTTVITNIQEHTPAIESKIYPNPITDHTNILLEDREDEIRSIIIYDIAGKVAQTEQGNNTHKQTIHKQDLIQGHYFIEIMSKNGISKRSLWIK
jgi:hypothetical protein